MDILKSVYLKQYFAYVQGRPSPSEAMMHFPCFRFPPYFRKMFRRSKILKMLPFPEKFLDFHPQKFLMTSFFFLVIDHKFRMSPCFPCFGTFPFCFAKIIIPPYFHKFPPCFRKIHLLFTYFMCISFPPYFDHDAFMQHPTHVLDASGYSQYERMITSYYRSRI